MQLLNFEGEPLDYPCLRVEVANGPDQGAIDSGFLYFHGKGEAVSEVWLATDVVRRTTPAGREFTYSADIAVVLRLSSMWIGLARTSHIMDAFYVSRGPSREDLVLPDSLSEWEADLVDSYEFSRSWTQLTA
jgi:hypothetical protein